MYSKQAFIRMQFWYEVLIEGWRCKSIGGENERSNISRTRLLCGGAKRRLIARLNTPSRGSRKPPWFILSALSLLRLSDNWLSCLSYLSALCPWNIRTRGTLDRFFIPGNRRRCFYYRCSNTEDSFGGYQRVRSVWDSHHRWWKNFKFQTFWCFWLRIVARAAQLPNRFSRLIPSPRARWQSRILAFYNRALINLRNFNSSEEERGGRKKKK